MTPLEEVLAQVLARVEPLGAEHVELTSAVGRTLAADVHASDPMPPFDNSSMDGFALRHADTADATTDAPVRLRVIGVAAAGGVLDTELAAGEAVRIYTGAPMPPGADCVVPFEDTGGHDDTHVAVVGRVRDGACIRRQGEELTPGQRVLARGQRLNAAGVGLLATVGVSRVSVGRRPRVAVHSSGDELIAVDEALTPGKIRNSNLYSIAARCQEVGAEPLPRPVLRDTAESVRVGLRQSLALRPDVIVTTGGVSAGDLDLVREVARELGDDIQVRKVRMKPGKPLVDGYIAGVPYFGLPGNPAACLVSFEIFVRPVLARLEGRTDEAERQHVARVRETQPVGGGPRLQFLRGRVELDPSTGEYQLLPTGGQGSHMLLSFAEANCLVRVPAGVTELAAGERVHIQLL